MTWDLVGIDTLFKAIVSVVVPLLAGAMLILRLVALERESTRRAAALAGAGMAPLLRRPTYRPRWRFPFRTLRSASLWIILAILAFRVRVRCTPDPQPAPAVIDCARDDSRLARASCALAAVIVAETIERLRR